MADIDTWSMIPANNNADPPDGWPEGMTGAEVPGAGRALMAAIAKLLADTNGTLSASHSSGNALTLSTNRSFADYLDGMVFTFKVAGTALSSGAVTLNVNGLGAKQIGATNEVSGKDLPVGTVVTVVYRDGRFALVGGDSAKAIEINTYYSDSRITSYISSFPIGPLRAILTRGTLDPTCISAATAAKISRSSFSDLSTVLFAFVQHKGGSTTVTGSPFPAFKTADGVYTYRPSTTSFDFYSIVLGI